MKKKQSPRVEQCNIKCRTDAMKCGKSVKGEMGCEAEYHKCIVSCVHS